ncbi:MAG: capsule assembly Wzi family protein, partial [Deltaproteobacteria bacterium]|nr:capsule assembly Wzi family protein [Deltaproteobacteria bacterium]
MWLFRARLCRPASVLPALFFFVLLCGVCGAGTSVNIPVGSRLYRDFERLEMKGLLESSMLATRPFDRLEGARLVTEAVDRAALNGVDGFSGARPLIYRLEREFSEELFAPGGEYARLKPVSSAYFKTLWVDDDPFFAEINNNGDNLRGGLNQRIGFVLTGSLFDAASFYLNPEFRADEDGARGRLVHGYVKLDFLGLSLLAGRDSLWWGPGFHGNLLVTNNAKPFDQVMLTSRHPFLLPWVFSRIGLLKPVVFLTRLEADRDYPRANLLGMRLDIKPTPNLELSLNRVFMFGGEG